ncbi:AraC-like DNA-binding protein [Silvibacterium bohemicum]|uniref:AraC-like DNA-binding protein n=1 Tax=Silvibacterium bohemicum TaxID=1577686 RepID=A0A841JSR8_9BACT|nr:AraC family transcriptional regulator [Silvibacterium bohemicum]MBB6144356.1 AraC-like DNA-binding protein [Silvibacterium bohemicum]
MEDAFISRSSGITDDPLSDVLSLLKPRGYQSSGIDAGGDWSFQFPQSNGFFCLALVSGHCWLSVNGVDEPVLLQAGEFAVLPHGPAFRAASDLAVAPVDFLSLMAEKVSGGILTWQGGGACLGLSAIFTFAGEHANILFEVLPTLIHIRDPEARVALQWYLERMMAVIRNPQPGWVLQGEYLAQMMLIEVLRLHMVGKRTDGVGWLFALANKQLSAAIAAMHERPGHRWTVQQLAERAGMSRSTFALRFKEQVGTSVMEYLIRWRMILAADRLVNSSDAVSSIALTLGYESESAFGFAFKREMGCSPRQYCRARASASKTSVSLEPGSETPSDVNHSSL